MTALLQAIFRYVAQILSLVTGIQMAQAAQATAEQTDAIKADTEEIKLKINDSTFGLAALQSQIATLSATLAIDVTALLTAIGTPQQAGDPVTIDPLSTITVSNASADAIATAVWVFDGPTTTFNAIDLLEDAAVTNVSWNDWGPAVRNHQLAGWQTQAQTFIDQTIAPGGDLLPLDFSTVLATDATAVDWLNRLWGSTYFEDWGGGSPGVIASDGNSYWVPWLQTPTFQLLRDQALGLTGVKVPPVWPGLAGVVLGTPVALAAGVTITAPMDGVIIAVTSYETKLGFFTFDTTISLRNAGALAFFTDNGQEELPQSLGFLDAVYCPKTMTTAAGVVVRLSNDIVGTITPWSFA